MHYSVGRLQIWNVYDYKHIKTEWMDTGEQYKQKLKHQESCATEINSTTYFTDDDDAIMLKEKKIISKLDIKKRSLLHYCMYQNRTHAYM